MDYLNTNFNKNFENYETYGNLYLSVSLYKKLKQSHEKI